MPTATSLAGSRVSPDKHECSCAQGGERDKNINGALKKILQNFPPKAENLTQ